FPIEKLKNLGFSSAITDSIGKLESKTTIGQAVRHQNSLWRLIQQALTPPERVPPHVILLRKEGIKYIKDIPAAIKR
ncbi:hypothetical protein POG22_10295, partial [Geitlerinema sp. CS-897]|nr:hypothetical protein [Geitlerinema sp. CS-897]